MQIDENNSAYPLSEFAWHSTENYSNENKYAYPDSVEIHYNKYDKNQYAEIAANQKDTSIYQQIATTPGSVYKWRISHSSFNYEQDDILNVLINDEIQENVYRVSENGCGDKIGFIGSDISTHVTRTARANAPTQFEDYEGIWTCPDEITSATFSFHNVDSQFSNGGNFVDNISFSIADPLYYDYMGGQGNAPVPEAHGSYPGYYPRGDEIDVTKITPTRAGYTFLGWSTEQQESVTNEAQLEELDIIESYTICPGINTVYAVWAKNPTITFIDSITNEPVSSTTIPFGTSLLHDDIPETPLHAYYDFVSYDKNPPVMENVYEDTNIILLYERNDTISIPVSLEWKDNKDYAQIRPETLEVVLLANDTEVDSAVLPNNQGKWEYLFSGFQEHNDTDGSPVIYKVQIRSLTSSYNLSIAGDVTSGFHLVAKHIETIDIPVQKIWDDMKDLYKMRPKSIEIELNKIVDGEKIPYDSITLAAVSCEEEANHNTGEQAETSNTLIVDQNDSTSSNTSEADSSWYGVFSSVPLWDENEEMIEYRISEPEVQGYDLISCEGSLKDGYVLTNRVWKHIQMPETGQDGLLIILISLTGMILLFSAFIGLGKRYNQKHKNIM